MKRPRLRRMKAYHPRKRTKRMAARLQGPEFYRQSLYDLKHKISSKLGRYLVLLEEGNKTLIQQAHQQARVNLLKYSGEMKQVARELGERVSAVVQQYLDTVDQVVHVQAPYVDSQKIQACYEMEQKLDQVLHVAA